MFYNPKNPTAQPRGGGMFAKGPSPNTSQGKSRAEMRADRDYQVEQRHKKLLEKAALRKLPITNLPKINLQDRLSPIQERLTAAPDLSYFDKARQIQEQGFETQRNRQQQEIGGALNRRLTALGQQTSGAGLGLMAKTAQDVNEQIDTQKQQALGNLDFQKAQMGAQLGESGKEMLFNIAQSGSQRDIQQAQFDLQRAAAMGDQRAKQALVQFEQLSKLREFDIAEKQAALDAQTTDFNKRMAQRNARSQETGNILGAIGTAAGLAAAFGGSDEKLKKNIKDDDGKVQEFLDNIASKEFEYLDPKAPWAAPGKRFGVMAQDLEKSEMGKSLVKNTKDGKMVNTVQGTLSMMSALGQINRRLKALEGKKG